MSEVNVNFASEWYHFGYQNLNRLVVGSQHRNPISLCAKKEEFPKEIVCFDLKISKRHHPVSEGINQIGLQHKYPRISL